MGIRSEQSPAEASVAHLASPPLQGGWQVSGTPGFAQQREGSLFQFVWPAEAPGGRPVGRKEGAFPQEDPHTCAGVWTGPEEVAQGQGRDPKVQPEAGHATSPETLGNQTAQDSVRPVFLSHVARLSVGVKTFCPWIFLARRERPQN